MKIEYYETQNNGENIGTINVYLANKSFGVNFTVDSNEWYNRTALAAAFNELQRKASLLTCTSPDDERVSK